eukprot:scpid57699/ scgid6427/ Translin; Component 3 of promoter of RISC
MDLSLSEDRAVEDVRCEFGKMKNAMECEQEIRSAIRPILKDLTNHTKEAVAILRAVHQSSRNTADLTQAARARLPQIQSLLKQLGTVYPSEWYHRYHDMWRNTCQNLSLLGSFIHYLQTGTLIRRSELADLLELSISADDGFCITLDDMLAGFLDLASELSRLAVNSVVHGDVERPVQIAAFINEMNSAFQLLNLKNDFLRRRYDGLKYDVRKVEEVVYDLSIRGLKNPGEPGSG